MLISPFLRESFKANVIPVKNVLAKEELSKPSFNPLHAALHNREVKGVLSALNTYDLDHGILLNDEEEQLLEINGKTIQFEPIWKWLLQ